MSAPRRLLRIVGTGNFGRLSWIVLLMIIVGVLEFITIGSFFPLLTLMFNPAAADQGAIGRALSWLGVEAGSMEDLARLAVAVLMLFLGKALFTGWALREGYRFSYDVQVNVGHRLLHDLLGRSYEYHIQRNSAVLLKNVTAEVLSLAANILNPVISLTSQLVVLLSLLALLAWISLGAAFAMLAVVGITTALIYAVSHRRLRDWGRNREARLAEMHRVAQEALLGIKTVKTHASADGVLRRYLTIGRDYAALNTRYQVAAAVPPLLLELFMFGGITVLVLFYIRTGDSLVTTLPLIGLIGAAAFRILPAGRRIFFNLVTVRYFWSSLEAVEREFAALTAAPRDDATVSRRDGITAAGATLPRMSDSVELRDVRYSYPDGRDALRGITLQIRRGSKVGIIGSSGAGKTTLLDVLLGLLRPDRGQVAVDGVPLDDSRLASWLAQIGYVSQQIFLVDGTVRDNVAFGVPDAPDDDAAIERALRQAQLWNLVARMPAGLDTGIGENGVRLSGGERQRLGVARALYRDPGLLILDEATSAIDVVTERALIRDVLDVSAELTVLVVAHRLSTVSACDHIVVLDEGRIQAEGTYDDLLRTSAAFADFARHGPPVHTSAPS